jgi:hypothetical protein
MYRVVLSQLLIERRSVGEVLGADWVEVGGLDGHDDEYRLCSSGRTGAGSIGEEMFRGDLAAKLSGRCSLPWKYLDVTK